MRKKTERVLMSKREMSRFRDPARQTDIEVGYRRLLPEYFEKSVGNTLERLENFPKYITRQSLTTFLARYEIFKQVLHIHGDVIECGVLWGGGLLSFAHFSSILEPINFQRRIVGFDTFKGFPALSSRDSKSNYGGMRAGAYSAASYEDILRCIELFDMNRMLNHLPKVRVVKGDACRTIPRYLKDNPSTMVSLLYLDFDIYKPTKVALQHLLPRMPTGAIIAFDELNDPSFPGETMAVLETVGISRLKIQRFSYEPAISYAVL